MSGRIKGLTVHAGGSAFHHFFHFRQRGRGGIPRSGHSQRAMGAAAVHGVLGSLAGQQTVNQAGGKGIPAAHAVQDFQVRENIIILFGQNLH